MRKPIKQGDPTSNGGVVKTAGSGIPAPDGRVFATVDDLAHCPDCKKVAPIVAICIVPMTMPNGRQMALHGDLVNCDCAVKPTVVATENAMLIDW